MLKATQVSLADAQSARDKAVGERRQRGSSQAGEGDGEDEAGGEDGQAEGSAEEDRYCIV